MNEELETTPERHPHGHVFSIIGIVLSTLVIVGTFYVTAVYMRSQLQSGQLAAVISSALVDLANIDRSEKDLGNLTVNPVLVAAAQAKADDMAEKGYFSHTSPEGYDSWHWFREVGYNYSSAGENLAVNFSDSEDVEKAWMNSPTHRANILNGKYTEVGIATAVGEYKGKKTVFVVQMFGTPAAKVSEPVLVTEPDEPAVAATEPATTTVLGTTDEENEGGLAQATTSAEPAPVITPDTSAPVISSVDVVTTSPKTMLRYVYLFGSVLLLLALIFTTGLEFQKHHTRHVVAAGALVFLMAGLLFVANILIFTTPLVSSTARLLGA